jgi:hypothetical protein
MWPEVLERVRRCRYCKREMSVSAAAYAENPFCNRCLPERVKLVGDPGIEWRLVGDYFKPVNPQRL